MVLRVDLPEGQFLADVGFGNLAPTTALELRPGSAELATPHEPMRLRPMGDEVLLEAQLGESWHHVYRVVPLARVDAEYEIANWFTATHPDSTFASNLIAARPGPNRTRLTLFNERLVTRQADGESERHLLTGAGEFRDALADLFGLMLPSSDIDAIVEAVARKGTRGPTHPSFA
jgi:N-hydroxyarylamine O-acetyltransferase